MRRLAIFGGLLLVIYVGSLRAANPEDLQFRVTFTSGLQIYRIGESIPMQITYSSDAEQKYYGAFTNPQPEFTGVRIQITPHDGVINPRSLLEAQGWAGSIGGSQEYVKPQPRTLSFDLRSWYRFEKPGHYTIVVTSEQIQRIKSPQEGGGKEALTLESDPIDLEILPADPAWNASQMEDIEQILNGPSEPGEKANALYRLALLDTRASVTRLVNTYLEGVDHSADSVLAGYLRESSQTDLIIGMLQAALKSPTATVRDGITLVLADLQTRGRLGILPDYPADPQHQAEWNETSSARAKVHDDYLAQDDALLTERLRRQSGADRAEGIYQLWLDAEGQKATSPVATARLAQLQAEVLEIKDDLDCERQFHLLTTAWQDMPHEQLLPLVIEFSKASVGGNDFQRTEAFQYWCSDWPVDCQAEILGDVAASKIGTPKYAILLLPEKDRPELDGLLKEALSDEGMSRIDPRAQRAAALVLRAGSPALVKDVDRVLDEFAAKGVCSGYIEGDLIGYLFRVSPEEGRKRLDSILERPKDYCVSEVLGTLNSYHYSDDMIPVVTRALDSPNFQSASTSAIFLSQHAPPSGREFLWRRLEKLWKQWDGQSAELDKPPRYPSESPAAPAAALQDALVSALMNWKGWQVSPEESDRLRSGCLTERCRQIAGGKMSLGL
jgi:hypothetical protein